MFQSQLSSNGESEQEVSEIDKFVKTNLIADTI